MGVCGLLKDFSGWTSAHGIPQIGSARNVVVRFIWIILYMGFFGYFGYNLYEIGHSYFSYGITVSTDIKFNQRDFPSITICNRNPYKKTKVVASSDSVAQEIEQLMKDYETAVGGSDPNPDKYGFKGKTKKTEKMSQAWTALVYIAKGLTDSVWATLAYKLDDVLLECRFGEQECTSSDFTQIKDPFYGACYTFNYMDPVKYSSSRGGSLFGLSLLLKNEQSEFLPINDVGAYRVTVHNHKTEPFPDAFGYNAANGFINSLGVKFGTTIRLKSPYGDCKDSTSEASTFFYNSSYSMEACLRSCFQKKIIANCTCADPRFETDTANTKSCSWLQASCALQTESATAAECACTQSCSDTTYSVTESQAWWPQFTNMQGNEKVANQDCGEKDPPTYGQTDFDTCVTWWNENSIRIEVFFERLSYQEMQSHKAYTITDIVTDLGGQIGLWLGWSVITVVEFLSFSLVVLCYCISATKGPVVVPDEDDHSNDLDEIQDWMGENMKKPDEQIPSKMATPQPTKSDVGDESCSDSD